MALTSQATLSARVVNPTLHVTYDPTGTRLVWFTRRRGPSVWTAPRNVVRRLLAFDPRVDDDVDGDLAERELLVDDPGPPPKMVRTLSASTPVAPDATIAPSARIVGHRDRLRLQRRGPEATVLSEHDLGDDVAAVARRLGGGPPDAGIDGRLAAAGVLQPDPDAFDLAMAAGLADLRRAWSTDGHVVTAGLVQRSELAALQAYLNARLTYGYLDGDLDVEGRRRFSVYDDPELEPLHWRLAPFVGAIVGAPVRPSYSFTAFYRGGGSVPAHRDLPQCRWTLSLAVDGPESVRAWQLVLDDDRIRCEVRWGVGEAAVFDGHRFAHWRPPLPTGTNATFFIAHFTPDAEHRVRE